MTNVFTLKGQLANKKETWLKQIERYEMQSPLERARFLFRRYVYEGYFDFVKSRGKDDGQTESIIARAEKGLEENSPEAKEKVEQAIFAIKSKGIP
jgi:hypothetical protein